MVNKKQKINLCLIIILMCNILFLFNNNNNVLAIGENWLSDYQYRIGHTITQLDDIGTDYQINLRIYNSSGTNSNFKLYINSYSLSTNFGDIRFTESDGSTELSYWMENLTSTYADFWIKITDDLSSSDVLFYVYFGKIDTITTSNGFDTFIFFDDFNDDSLDTEKWNMTKSASSTFTESNGYAYFSIPQTNANNVRLQTYESFTYGALRFKLNCSVGYYNYLFRNWGFSSTPKYTIFDTIATSGLCGINYNTAQYYNILNNSILTPQYTYDLFWNSSHTIFKVQDTLLESVTTQVPNSTLLINIEDTSVQSISPTSSDMFVDYVFLRKFISTEPLHGDFETIEEYESEPTSTPTSTPTETPTEIPTSTEINVMSIGLMFLLFGLNTTLLLVKFEGFEAILVLLIVMLFSIILGVLFLLPINFYVCLFVCLYSVVCFIVKVLQVQI